MACGWVARSRSTRSKCVGSWGLSMLASRGRWKSHRREIQKRSAAARSIAGSRARSEAFSLRTLSYAASRASARAASCRPLARSMAQSFRHTARSNSQVSVPAK
ncbi:hypothetical protein D3C87_804190 [compost metagenome]